MIVRYELPVLLSYCPDWWQKFLAYVKSHNTDDFAYTEEQQSMDLRTLLRYILNRRYNATLQQSLGSNLLIFDDDTLHMLFMLEWA